MRLAFDHYAYMFWIVFVLIFFLAWSSRRRANIMRKFAEPHLLPELSSSVNIKRRKTKAILVLVALSFGIIALMRPQWGFRWEEVRRRGLDILIAIDTSKSMLATDVKPNRLERSKLAVKDLLKRLRGDRIGLIAFAGNAYLQCPLTIDYEGFLLALNELSVNTIPYGGTSIKSAIKTAIGGYEGGEKKYKALVIITDGEDHQGDTVLWAKKAAQEGVKIFCIGIGTKEGDLIQITDKTGKKVFLKDREGNVVKSRLNENILEEIAFVTGGAYVRSSGALFGLDLIYDEKLSKMEKKDIEGEMKKVFTERFQAPLFFALLLLLVEIFLSDKNKRLAVRKLWKTTLFFLVLTQIPIPVFAGMKNKVKEGNLLYNKGEFEKALKQYEEAFLEAPDSDIVNFNLGSALYKTEDYKGAISHFEKALITERKRLLENASYNMANAEYKYGISKEDSGLEEAIRYLERSLGHYEQALSIDPEDEDAEYNYEFVKKELERLKKKLEEEKKKKKRKDDKKENPDKGDEEKTKEKDRKEEERGGREKEKPKSKKPEESQRQRENMDKETPQKTPKEPEQPAKSTRKEIRKDAEEEPAKPFPERKPATGTKDIEGQEKMSEEEARMLLRGYSQEDEPKGLYKEKMPRSDVPEAIKDW